MTETNQPEVDRRHTDATPCSEASEALLGPDLRCVEVPNTADVASHFFAHLLH
ncbi:hypothetical protein [Streptomyces cucumeris]|uniref:hypothetical protein n=1 Tax=Streptomyces cucumeris TaxID=2962890 RepID=UPI003D70479C